MFRQPPRIVLKLPSGGPIDCPATPGAKGRPESQKSIPELGSLPLKVTVCGVLYQPFAFGPASAAAVTLTGGEAMWSVTVSTAGPAGR
jgi:hypothetical protein